MYHSIKVNNEQLFSVIEALLDQGKSVRIAVSGGSMYPFLRHGLDSVELKRGDFKDVARGDIVMIRRRSGQYIMHRVCQKQRDCFYMVGDAQQWIEGPLYQDQLFAVIPAVWRRNRKIRVSNPVWRILTGCWLILLPIRGRLLQVYAKTKQQTKKLQAWT
ncbi:MAG: S24/S26 family peptidase [Solirubrobacterales bacterium]